MFLADTGLHGYPHGLEAVLAVLAVVIIFFLAAAAIYMQGRR